MSTLRLSTQARLSLGATAPAMGAPDVGTERRWVSWFVKFFYGLGAAGTGVTEVGFSYMLLPYYQGALGLSGSFVGSAVLISMLVDAVTDPLVGQLSDAFRSKLFGRRHLFMYLSVVPACVCTYFLWNPPAHITLDRPWPVPVTDLIFPPSISDGGSALFGWLVCFTIFLRISNTLFTVPHTALVPEFTDDYDERTQLTAIYTAFLFLFGLGLALIGFNTMVTDSEPIPLLGISIPCTRRGRTNLRSNLCST